MIYHGESHGRSDLEKRIETLSLSPIAINFFIAGAISLTSKIVRRYLE